MFIVNNRKFFFILSAVLVIGSIFSMYFYGLKLGTDFTGGSLMEISYTGSERNISDLRVALDKLDLGTYTLQPTGKSNFTLRTHDLSNDEKNKILEALSFGPASDMELVQFTSIGPVVGNELKNKAMIAIGIVVLCIVLFITFAFRKVSLPVASWKYGLATIVALAHDVVIPTGVFVAWTHFHGGEIDLLFVTALLAILGYSVHDTIVVFDRVRENLKNGSKDNFTETVGKSVTQTFGRSINTSLTIFLSLVALYFIGGESTKDFAFVLLVGVIAGTYSSIFVASPLLVTLEKLQK